MCIFEKVADKVQTILNAHVIYHCVANKGDFLSAIDVFRGLAIIKKHNKSNEMTHVEQQL